MFPLFTSVVFCCAALVSAGQIDGQEKTMARHWHEQLLQMSHLASGDPTTHSRDFFHFGVVLWEVWRVFNDTTADSIIGKQFLPTDIATPSASNATQWSALEETIGQACFEFLTVKGWPRFQAEIVGNFTLAMNATGLSPDAQSLGARLGRAVQAYAVRNGDMACEAEQYKCSDPKKRRYQTVNPHRCVPLWDGVGGLLDPNHWQRLDIGAFIDKAGIQVSGYPEFTTPQFGDFETFALRADEDSRSDPKGTVWFDPGSPPVWGPSKSSTHEQFIDEYSTVAKLSSWFDILDQTWWSVSPGNHTLGTNNVFQHTTGCNTKEYREVCANVGVGHEFNPATGKPYEPNTARRGDFVRILTEFWSRQFWQNGPESDSPIRQWNTMLDRDILDHEAFQFRYAGGTQLSRVEYEIRAYLMLNAAFFDSSIAAWSIKRHYDSVRPVTAIRFMSTLGQSTDKTAESYHPGGIPLIPFVTRVVKPTDICTNLCGNYEANRIGTVYSPGPLFWLGFHRIGTIAVRSWQPWANVDDDGVAWLPGPSWMPFRRPSFVTPPFPAYVSGHSTYSRAAADILTYITGDHFWPGGLKTQFAQNDSFFAFDSSTFRGGIARDVTLQYATYSDAADECAISRLYAGAHIPSDDVPARHIGRMVAQRTWEKLSSKKFFGPPSGERVAVRFVAAIGSDIGATVEWAKDAAIKAHQMATMTSDTNVQVQVIGRGPGQPERTRTVIIARTSPSAAEELRKLLDEHAEVPSEILTCNDLECTDTSNPLSSWVIVGICLAVSVVVGLLIVVGACVVHRIKKNRVLVV